MIKEVIIVEGKDDIASVKAAVDAEVISTHGYAYGKEFIKLISEISKSRGIIILTDPDFVGERIRRDIASQVKNCKHAFLPKDKALKGDDVGVENATAKDIKEAIYAAKPIITERIDNFTMKDMIRNGLSGGKTSKSRREKLGKLLKIGNANASQMLKRLNSFGITREEFEEAVKELDK
ncbi:MAG: ribonuclease M5 [Tissierellia bacterium]|nr:ribonuclease M5 [Tissierellia bacterium]